MSKKRKIKLVAIDLDGTLLTSKRAISALTAETVSKVARQGIHIILVSARMLPSVLSYKKQLNLRDPVIAYDGAVIKPNCSKAIWLGNIDPNIAIKIILFSKLYDARLFTYVGNKWYIDNFSSEAEEESRAIRVAPIIVDDLQEVVNPGVTKFTIIGKSNFLVEIADYLSQEFSRDICCIFSRPTDLEIFKKGISKSNALDLVGNLLCIQPSQMMAIGDERNDIDMLNFAGTAIAMGNAPYEVKKIADLIAPTNDNDGVALILNHFFVNISNSDKLANDKLTKIDRQENYFSISKG
jgi:hypothetical protein